MLKPKPLIFASVIIILLVGVYEKRTGSVMNGAYHFGKKAGTIYHLSFSGDFLICFSLFIAAIASYVFRKD